MVEKLPRDKTVTQSPDGEALPRQPLTAPLRPGLPCIPLRCPFKRRALP